MMLSQTSISHSATIKRQHGVLPALFLNASEFTQKQQGITACISDIQLASKTTNLFVYQGVTEYDVRFRVSGVLHFKYCDIEISNSQFQTPEYELFNNSPDLFITLTKAIQNGWKAQNIFGTTLSVTTTQGTSFSEASNLASKDLAALFVNSRKRLIKEAWLYGGVVETPGHDTMRSLLWQLSDHKSMLWALSQIGLPSAFDSDQRFRAFLSEPSEYSLTLLDSISLEGLLQELVTKASDDEVSKFDIAVYEKTAKGAVSDFRALLSSKLDAIRSTGDLPEALVSALAGIEKVGSAYQECHKGNTN